MTLENIKKAGYVAVGAPIAVAKTVSAHVDAIRNSFRDLGDRMGDDLADELDRWVEEGRSLVDRITSRVDEQVDAAQTTSATAKERLADASSRAAGAAKDTVTTAKATLTEVPIDLTEISGVGPAFAERLHEAGVVTTNALVARVATSEGLERLAESTGFTSEQLTTWAEQADLTSVTGIGEEYSTLLQLAGVGSRSALAASDAAELTAAMADANSTAGVVDQLPSQRTVAGWIGSAR